MVYNYARLSGFEPRRLCYRYGRLCMATLVLVHSVQNQMASPIFDFLLHHPVLRTDPNSNRSDFMQIHGFDTFVLESKGIG